MSLPADENAPVVYTADAIRDFGTVVDHILERRSLEKINILGWSWGTTIVAGYTAGHNDKVNRLAMYAPVWIADSVISNGPPENLPAYRGVGHDDAKARWVKGIPLERRPEILPDDWFEVWWQSNLEAGPEGAALKPPVIQAPNGVIDDIFSYWLAGSALYEPADIHVPTLLVVAEWDTDTPLYMTQTLFPLLKNTPSKRAVLIGEGTHTIILEKNRLQLFREVQLFLDEPETP